MVIRLKIIRMNVNFTKLIHPQMPASEHSKQQTGVIWASIINLHWYICYSRREYILNGKMCN